MTKSTRFKAALIALLVAAALIGQFWYGRAAFGGPWPALAMLLFGIVNVLIEAPGTETVRGLAIVAALAVLLVPTALVVMLIAVAIWLVWPPAFTVAWALGREANPEAPPAAATTAPGAQARITVAALIAAVAIASLVFRVLVVHNLQQTAALFVGIPALLAIAVVFSVTPKSATGVACKAVTVGLLVSLVFLGEGMLCVAMSAPLFYAVAIVVARTMSVIQRRNDGPASTLFSCAILLAIVPASLEGVIAMTTVDRGESVAESRVVNAPAADVERALFATPRFERLRPLFLRVGLPRAVAVRVEGLEGEARWVIQVRGGEMRLDGMEPRTGDLVLALEEARPGLIRWRAISDSSHTTHFLDWQESIVQWQAIDARTTRVTWTLKYRRGLDPSWYFGPWERYAVRLSAGYLIDAVATP